MELQQLRRGAENGDPECVCVFTAPFPTKCKQLDRLMEKKFGTDFFVYDLCAGTVGTGRTKKCCNFIYRCEARDNKECPRCTAPRYDANGKPRKVFVYHSALAYIRHLYQDPDLSRCSPRMTAGVVSLCLLASNSSLC